MEAKEMKEETALEEKVEVLIAIGAATAANCIPCFESLYEQAVTSGISSSEIKRSTEIADRVKSGARGAISNTIDELIGSKEVNESACGKTSAGSCCC